MTVTGSREALKRPTPLERLLRVMESALSKGEPMAVWSDDVRAVVDAVVTLAADPAPVLTVEEIERVLCCPHGCTRGPESCWSKTIHHAKGAVPAILSLLKSRSVLPDPSPLNKGDE